MEINLREKALEIERELVAIRRDFHQNPELSFQEFKTAAKIVDKLKNLGIEVTEGVGGTGVVGLLKGQNSEPVVALRGDIDALPIEELNDVEYKSKVPGVMHACGHDVHTTSLLGAALLLSSVKDKLKGSVKFIFQPAEEKNQGAKDMMKDNVLEKPMVSAIFGLHNSPNIEAGKVGVKAGPLMAAVDTTKITIKGEGGHGAVPDKTRDAIVSSAAVIQNLQTIVSRKVSPFDSVVVSFGVINGGQANNVIADSVEILGTVRTYNPDVQKKIPILMENIIKNTCEALGTEGFLDYKFDLPAVINDEKCAEIGRKAVEKIVGKEGVVEPKISGGGEDFSIFLQKVPGCFFFLGVRNEEEGITHEWHHPRFNIDERALPVGAGILAQSVIEYFAIE